MAHITARLRPTQECDAYTLIVLETQTDSDTTLSTSLMRNSTVYFFFEDESASPS